MDRERVEALNASTVERYNARLDEAGPGAYALGWGEERYQRKRFRDLLHALEPEDFAGRHVLDIGCGLGDLLAFLRQDHDPELRPRHYTGIDINDRFLGVARDRYPDSTFEVRDLVLEPYEAPIADTGVILGVINFELGEEHEAHAHAMIRHAFEAVRGVLAVNVISDVHNEDYPREDFIHYYEPWELLRFGQSVTPFCSLVHDYKGLPQHEMILVMRHEPWRTFDGH